MRSVSIALFALFLALPGFAQTQKTRVSNSAKTASTPKSGTIEGNEKILGRYQIVFGDQGAFLVDTCTGKVWQRKIFGVSTQPQAWFPMDRLDSEGEVIDWERTKTLEAAAVGK